MPVVEVTVDTPDLRGVSVPALHRVTEYCVHFSPHDAEDDPLNTLMSDEDSALRPPTGGAGSDAGKDRSCQGCVASPTPIPRPLSKPIEEVLSPWERDFIQAKLLDNYDIWSHELLIQVLRAARYLQIHSLEAMLTAWCSSQILHFIRTIRTAEEAAEHIRKFLSVHSDWTPQELESLRIENDWPEEEWE